MMPDEFLELAALAVLALAALVAGWLGYETLQWRALLRQIHAENEAKARELAEGE